MDDLFQREGDADWPMPPAIASRYGHLGFPTLPDRPYVFANFVTTFDGIVSYGIPGRAGAAAISRRNATDRFVMGLLRACADAIIVGAGTLRVERPRSWLPADIHPQGTSDFAALRASLGKSPNPVTFFVTGSGDVDLASPIFTGGEDVRIVTCSQGAARMPGASPRLHVVGTEGSMLSVDAIIATVVKETGARHILTEGGPHLFGQFLAARRVDELFLTVAPQVAGRSARTSGLLEGTSFEPDNAPWGELVSVKRDEQFLFLRYAFATLSPDSARASNQEPRPEPR